jgi:hypothetical protein
LKNKALSPNPLSGLISVIYNNLKTFLNSSGNSMVSLSPSLSGPNRIMIDMTDLAAAGHIPEILYSPSSFIYY